MRALTVAPGTARSARVEEMPAPTADDDEVLVGGIAVGVCGTDREIVDGAYGSAPPGRDRLVLGHESLGRVIDAPDGSELSVDDLVVGIVRRPDPEPCAACAVGQWDMCRNGRYTEHGIKERDGFAAERYALPIGGALAVPVRLGDAAVLVEPASIVAKAWDHIDHVGGRAAWFPERVLVTGAGPIGLLAALFATQRGYDVHVLDIVTSGPKPKLVRALGATYHHGSVTDACSGADIVVECTGVGELVAEVLTCTAPAGIVCLTGMSSGEHHLQLDVAGVNRELVLQNDVVFGSVNANAGHYRMAIDALARADPDWLRRLITRSVPLQTWESALEQYEGDVKVVIDLTDAAS
jgi:threonine dehydrogenase-like Zn-dependent dehydrogenase